MRMSTFSKKIFKRKFLSCIQKSLLIFSILSTADISICSAQAESALCTNGMVVSASSYASSVGVEILKNGGNAVDAAVAVGFALAVTFPSAGNLGGGGFMVIHFSDGRNITIDFREKAPFLSRKDMFIDKNGNFLPELSTEGTTSAGVPGSVAGLIYVLEKYGTMDLCEVIQPAIELAEDGFALDFYSAQSFNWTFSDSAKYPSSYKIFSNSGMGFKTGDIFTQPDLAHTLELIRENGADGFYKGEIAEHIVQQVKKLNGIISLKDLEEYEPIEREPVSGTYRNYKIVSMPPPSSGGIALIQLLNILENFHFDQNDWGSSSYIHKLTEAMKYVYADRSVHLGDPDFYKVPMQWLISKDYAKEIFQKISDSASSSPDIIPGKPFSFYESLETTHFSVYDSYGNAVSTTTTLNSAFGNKIVVEGAGFLLNNEMDDFSAKPGMPNQFGLLGNEANAVEPGKRMLSSMTPTIILKDDKPFLILGSPGGSMIITSVLQVIMNVIDFGMKIQDAINAPRIHHQWFPDEIYYDQFALPADVKENLLKKGNRIGLPGVLGCVEGILIDRVNNKIFGVSDRRGNGSAEGY